jgi:hypothetical protein
MANPQKPPSYLQLVDSTPSSSAAELLSTRKGWQRSLFAASNSSLLCFLDMSGSVESDFLSVILDGRPTYAVDLRLVPTFDIGSLTRKLAFDLFGQVGCKYLDASGLLGIADRRDAQLNPMLLVPRIASLIGSQNIEGPLLILVEGAQSTDEYISTFTMQAQSLRPQGWDLLVIPEAAKVRKQSSRRNLVLVSHANPEDNEFTRWLVTQLTMLGYEVWSDLTKLVGGTYFWTSIEDAIRNHAAKVVIVVSRDAQQKAGVLDEINCALSVERKERIGEFVIPIKIDELPFDEVIANLARKMILDFTKGWIEGLAQLHEALTAADVPRGQTATTSVSMLWSATSSTREILPASERLISNWLRIERLPEEYLLDSKGVKFTERYSKYDGLNYENTDGAKDRRLMRLGCALRGELSSTDFREVWNSTTSLLRESWNIHAEGIGLKAFVLSNRRIAWYVPCGLLRSDTSNFKAMDGKKRRKILAGKSEKRQAFWHFGVELKPVLAKPARFVLLSHVIFTKDGQEDHFSSEKMHSLRRGFCKSWWNDRWRDLELAFLSWMAPSGRMDVATIKDFGFSINCKPLQFTSPVSLKPTVSDSYDSLIADVEWDELDTGEMAGFANGEESFDEV